jgi:hypothetical protein
VLTASIRAFLPLTFLRKSINCLVVTTPPHCLGDCLSCGLEFHARARKDVDSGCGLGPLETFEYGLSGVLLELVHHVADEALQRGSESVIDSNSPEKLAHCDHRLSGSEPLIVLLEDL